MNKVSSLTICRDNYSSKNEFEDAIKQIVMFLLNEDYIMTVKYDEKSLGIVVIEYESSFQDYGAPYPYWLLPNEMESVVFEDE